MTAAVAGAVVAPKLLPSKEYVMGVDLASGSDVTAFAITESYGFGVINMEAMSSAFAAIQKYDLCCNHLIVHPKLFQELRKYRTQYEQDRMTSVAIVPSPNAVHSGLAHV